MGTVEITVESTVPLKIIHDLEMIIGIDPEFRAYVKIPKYPRHTSEVIVQTAPIAADSAGKPAKEVYTFFEGSELKGSLTSVIYNNLLEQLTAIGVPVNQVDETVVKNTMDKLLQAYSLT
jgi:hypothetical protein